MMMVSIEEIVNNRFKEIITKTSTGVSFSSGIFFPAVFSHKLYPEKLTDPLNQDD